MGKPKKKHSSAKNGKTVGHQDETSQIQQKYANLVNNVNVGVYRNTPGPEGRFLEANPAIISMFEARSKEEFLKHTVSDLYQDPEKRIEFSQKIQKYGFVKNEELQLITLRGRNFWGAVTAVKVTDKNGQVFFDGIIEDISDRKRTEEELNRYSRLLEEMVKERTVELKKANERLQLDIAERMRAEESLKESEEKFRILAEQSPNMIFINKKGRIIYANAKCEELMGYTRAEYYAADFDFMVLIAPESRPQIKLSLAAHMQGKDVDPYEYSLLTRTGQRIDAIISTKLIKYENEISILGVVTDITERKRIEEILRKNETFLQNAFDSIMDGISVLDKDMNIVRVNHAMKTMYSHALPLVGKKCYTAYHNRTERCETCHFLKVFRHGTPQMDTVPLAGPDGRQAGWLEIYASPLLDDLGNVSGLIEYVRDITERKKLEEQFLQAQKLEAIGKLAGGIVHDFNNLLTSIIVNSDLLLSHYNPGEPLYDEIKTIKESGERAGQLTRRLLAFTRKQVIDPVVIDLNEIINGMRKMLASLMGREIRQVFNLEPNLKWIKVDFSQIEQVILNLVINARDAMPGGGTLSISTKNITIDEKKRKELPEFKAGEYVLISVSDTGIGMPPEIAERLFEPFFTTKEQGTGLGLTTVYGIVKQIGGYIKVRTKKGRGTVFKIYLPAPNESVKNKQAGREKITELYGTETILVIDDEPSILNLVTKILANLGYTVLSAKDKDEAFAKTRTHKGVLDLLLTDIVLPGKKGPEIAADLKKRHDKMKVLFMSGYANGRIDHTSGKNGKFNFIFKPFTASGLAQKVRDVLDGK